MVISAAYESGLSSDKIAAHVGCSEPPILRALKKHGVVFRPRNMFSEERKRDIVAAYVAGKTADELGATFGCSTTPILRAVRDADVERRKGGPPYKYRCNRRFFQSIDSEEKAYWLGMIASDGCVSERRHSMSINLKVSDHSHLEKFRAALQTDTPVRVYRRTAPSVRLDSHFSIISPELVSDLTRLGIVPRKSLVLTPPTLEPSLMRHFWRGCIDGDGSIGYYGKWSLHYVGSAAMVYAFRAFMQQACGTRVKMSPHFKVFFIRISGNRIATKAMDALYEGATVYLDRKFALYQRAKARI